MVRALLLFIIILLFQNCCYNGFRNNYNIPRSKKVGFYNEFDNTIFNEIDTSCVYEGIGYYKNNKVILYKDYSHGKIFIKFYSKGRIAKFTGIGFDQKLFKTTTDYKIIKNDFDSSKAYMGYYIKENYTITANQFLNNQCQMFWVKSEIIVKKDTLIQKYNRFYNNIVYFKRILPKEFLIYKPDW